MLRADILSTTLTSGTFTAIENSLLWHRHTFAASAGFKWIRAVIDEAFIARAVEAAHKIEARGTPVAIVGSFIALVNIYSVTMERMISYYILYIYVYVDEHFESIMDRYNLERKKSDRCPWKFYQGLCT